MNASPAEPSVVGVVLKGYPRLSETFIAQELLGLERRGLRLHIVSLRHPSDPAIHPIIERIAAPVTYLPEYLHREPVRVLRAWWRMRRSQRYRQTRRSWLHDLRRDPSRSRVRRFGQALVLAHEEGARLGHLHAHFLHTPASVTRYAAELLGRAWSVSAHAKDVWTIPGWELGEKIASCAWLVTCTRANAEHLRRAAGERAARIHLAYHGLDRALFPPPPVRAAPIAVSTTAPLTILSVGRAVEKKGFPVLLRALARLDATLDWRLEHIGAGPGLPALQAQARQLGLAGRVRWRGPRRQPEVLAAYRAADLFVLASVVTEDGDRDGLPNVLLEACSQRLACLASDVSGIPELIEHGVSGWLVTPGDVAGLAEALALLLTDAPLRARLGAAGAARVAAGFAPDRGLDLIAAQLTGEAFGPSLDRGLDRGLDQGPALGPDQGPDRESSPGPGAGAGHGRTAGRKPGGAARSGGAPEAG